MYQSVSTGHHRCRSDHPRGKKGLHKNRDSLFTHSRHLQWNLNCFSYGHKPWRNVTGKFTLRSSAKVYFKPHHNKVLNYHGALRIKQHSSRSSPFYITTAGVSENISDGQQKLAHCIWNYFWPCTAVVKMCKQKLQTWVFWGYKHREIPLQEQHGVSKVDYY